METNGTGRVAGKVAIVTGGAQGMGEAHVRMLAEHGARVVIADIDEHRGAALAGELGTDTMHIRLDVSDPDDWQRLVVATSARFGGIDVLINNAGILAMHRVDDVSFEEYRKTIEVNQFGVFLGMQAVIPSMKRAGGGSIINISSTAGMVGTINNFAYAASKWAVRGMTKAAALELASYGIRVNVVAPGEVTTQMIADLDLDMSDTPIGRFGRPKEIAYLALYLASDESSYTTGADYVIDGGYTVP
jgi:3alpha(or 20beta)-hydroxysteroid dehydrogenase